MDQNNKLPAHAEEDLLDLTIHRVESLVNAGETENLRRLIGSLMGYRLPPKVEVEHSTTETVRIATIIGPLAELWSEADRPLVIHTLHPDCGKDGGPLRKLNTLLRNLIQDIDKGTPFPAPSGGIEPLRKMPVEDAIAVVEDILRLQIDGRIQIAYEVPFSLRDADYA